jgi:hypothetical protein
LIYSFFPNKKASPDVFFIPIFKQLFETTILQQTYKMFSKALILALIPTAFGHMGLFHPSAYDFDGDGYSLVTPLSGQSFKDWWFHGTHTLHH